MKKNSGLLRIRAALGDSSLRCQWSLLIPGHTPEFGEGLLSKLPKISGAVQMILPAADVLILRAQLPPAARRRAGSLLAYAVEDDTASEPDSNEVSWLGAVNAEAGMAQSGADVLAVIDKSGLTAWRSALLDAGIRDYQIHCETLLLPWQRGQWTMVWNGSEGIVRTGQFEGSVTDRGNAETPPLSLRMLVQEAESRGQRPAAIAMYSSTGDGLDPASVPVDLAAWSRELGVNVQFEGLWDWRTAPSNGDSCLVRTGRRWIDIHGMAGRLKLAAGLLVAAFLIHGVALILDWSLLAREQQALRSQMETDFRKAFPEAVAIIDPALQMRRNLVSERQTAGLSDSSDFLPMLEQLAVAIRGLPAPAIKTISYTGGRLIVEFTNVSEAGIAEVRGNLLKAGVLDVQSSISSGSTMVLTMINS